MLLCVVSVGLWGRSYYTWELVSRRSVIGWAFWSGRGQCGFYAANMSGSPELAIKDASFRYEHPPALPWLRDDPDPSGVLHYWRGFGFDITTGVPGNPKAPEYVASPFVKIIVPYWFIVLITIVLPVYWIKRQVVARRRLRVGLCRVCSYNLRATPDRCPECGAVPKDFPVSS
ncbi:MAG: hypothetical protein JWO48_2020 [Bryobacterales bacterium]|nr:hypothetical protein [Bryobacterales bacterium]